MEPCLGITGQKLESHARRLGALCGARPAAAGLPGAFHRPSEQIVLGPFLTS